MSEQRLLLDTLVDMTAASVERVELDDRTLMLVRLAALAAVDGPTGSYLLNLEASADAGLTLEDARSVLIAVAPIVGTARIVSAAGAIAEALGLALDIEEALASGDSAD